MSEKKSIIKNYLYNLAYQILIIILPFITVPYVSRVLGSDGVGIYSYISSIATYFMLFRFSGNGVVWAKRNCVFTKSSQK